MNQKQAADHPPRLHIPCDEFIQKKKEDRGWKWDAIHPTLFMIQKPMRSLNRFLKDSVPPDKLS